MEISVFLGKHRRFLTLGIDGNLVSYNKTPAILWKYEEQPVAELLFVIMIRGKMMSVILANLISEVYKHIIYEW
jgi:hypothetical protein